jgi:hypothetical protein
MRAPANPAADLIGKLGDLMERYPVALMDSSRLPASKQTMKTVIEDVWRREPALRGQLAHAYLYLSHFQDGKGNEILDGKIPGDLKGTEDLEAIRQQATDLTEGRTILPMDCVVEDLHRGDGDIASGVACVRTRGELEILAHE